MKIEKGIISSSELTFLVIGFIESSTLTAAFISGVTKQDTWILLLIGFFIMLFLLFVYISLNKKFPNKNLIEINDLVYGRHFGKVISILYIYYFWFLIPANFRFIADFFSTYLFPETDISVFIIAIAIISIYTIKKGLEVIARSVSIIAILIIVEALIITILTAKYIRLSNFLPMLQLNLKEFILGINLIISIPFGEIIVFSMIFPYVNNKKQVSKSVFSGFFIGSMFFLIVILRNISVLGNIGIIHVLPSYQVARLVNVGEVITRMEVLIALALLFNIFVKISIFYYATVLSIAQFFKLKSYRPLVIPVGIISIVLSISMYNSPAEEVQHATSIYPIYAIPFIILIPIISFIIISIKKLK